VQDTSCRDSGGGPHLKKSPKIGGYRGLIETISASSYSKRLLRKRCRILPAGGLGVSPSFKSPPRLGDIGG